MYLLPGNPFSQAVEAYRDSGEALCSKGMQAVTPPFILYVNLFDVYMCTVSPYEAYVRCGTPSGQKSSFSFCPLRKIC